jgi:hypothetical protein
MVQISAAETVFRIWSRSDQKGLGQTKNSRSDPNILDPTGSGFLTLSRTQKGLFNPNPHCWVAKSSTFRKT